MYSHRMNSPKNLAQYSGNASSKIFSCIRASANTGPACIRADINSPRSGVLADANFEAPKTLFLKAFRGLKNNRD